MRETFIDRITGLKHLLARLTGCDGASEVVRELGKANGAAARRSRPPRISSGLHLPTVHYH